MDRREGARPAAPPEAPRGGALPERWSVLGAVGGRGAMAVDPAGRIVTGRNGWSLAWEVLTGTGRVLPGFGSTARQAATGAGAAVPAGLETVVRVGDGDISQLAYVCLPPTAAAGAVGVLEVRNDTSTPVAVRLAVRPGDFWRSGGLWRVQVDDAGVHANGSPALWWERPPAEVRVADEAAAALDTPGAAARVGDSDPEVPRRARSRQGRAGATLTWPVAHGSALRVLLPLQAEASPVPVPADLPTLAQVGGGWEAHAGAGLRVDGLASGRAESVAAAAIRRLLALEVGAEASRALDGRFSPAERALLAAALAVAGFARRAAEMVSLRAARRPEAIARLARAEAARIAARFDGGVAAVGSMAASAGPTGGWASDRSGDDPLYRAAYLLALRDLLVSERHGVLDLLAGVAATADLGRGRPSVEVHRLGTGRGVLSFALRWHAATPALLWELVPPGNRLESWAAAVAGAGTGGGTRPADLGPLRITAAALAATWSTPEPAGEALLRP